jgi:hypothetical protein
MDKPKINFVIDAKVSEWLVGLGIDVVIGAKNFNPKGPCDVFSDNGVEMRQTEQAA